MKIMFCFLIPVNILIYLLMITEQSAQLVCSWCGTSAFLATRHRCVLKSLLFDIILGYGNINTKIPIELGEKLVNSTFIYL